MLETIAHSASETGAAPLSIAQCEAEPLARMEDYEEFLAGLNNFRTHKWNSDRWITFRLRFGIYAQKQEGMHMARAKVPGGRMRIEWLRAVAKANREHCGADVHITTRQGLQFYFVTLDSLPKLFKEIYSAGLTSREASGNTFRNTTACPLAGICPRERVDAGAVAQRLAVAWLRHPLVQHMPRKVKTSVSGCELDCGATSIDDLGLIATVKDGRHGFRVVAGGGLGSVPRFAVELLEFVAEEELSAVQEAVAHMHHRYSNRHRKMASRIKFLVKRFGEEEFVKMFMDEFEHARRMPQRPWAALTWRTPADDRSPPPQRGRIEQHNGGVAVVIRPPLGMLSSDRLEALADIAERTGAAEFRLTREQNIIAVGIPRKNAEKFIDGVRALGLDMGERPHGLGDIVACPGVSTCPIGINNSHALAEALLADGDAFAALPETRIRISGCHNSCGQHHIGDIGLHGVAKKIGGKSAPHYQFHLGGEADTPGAIAMDGPAVPARHTKEALKILLSAYAETRGKEESVRRWAKRIGAAGIEKFLAPVTEGGYDADDPSVWLDVGSDKPFFPPITAVGECAASAVVGEYLSDLSEVGRIDLQRALAIGDREEAMEAGRRSLFATIRRLLSVLGVDMEDFDDSRLIMEVKSRLSAEKTLMASLETALKAKTAAAGGGDMEAFSRALADLADAADAVVEASLAPPAAMGANI